MTEKQLAKSQGKLTYLNKNPCKYGHMSEKYVSNSGCVECSNLKNKSTTTKKKQHDKYKLISKFYIKNMWWRAKKRAEKKGIEFTIQQSDIVIPGCCPVYGFKFQIGEGNGPSDYSPSLDRIDNNKGYIKDNIQVISFKANKIKNDSTLEDIEILLEFLKKQ
ncbi:hypothetical protein UFOVP250_168 [uncultured Caudovirales phage]|uniref:Uncharacterized protein n=1 Tax=uncultured Caudovirales phage TaxID=2100421 RepID=A0A6J5LIN7_9CAUD|nr:hypothetical protein UFOVP250_168 [uncultured Caudovirales phage]